MTSPELRAADKKEKHDLLPRRSENSRCQGEARRNFLCRLSEGPVSKSRGIGSVHNVVYTGTESHLRDSLDQREPERGPI